MKKIVILTDIHANNYLLMKVWQEIEAEGYDELIVCGDMITDGFENEEIVSFLRSKTNHLILGNREESIINYDGYSWENEDRWKSFLFTYKTLSDESMAFLKSLYNYKVIEIEGKKICFSHGSPYNVRDMVSAESEELFDRMINDFPADIYLFGHTHIDFYREYKGKIFLNTGAISLGCYPNKSTYGVLEIDGDNVSYSLKSVDYDFEMAKQYYLNHFYSQECIVWCNTILYTLKTGLDYGVIFIEWLNDHPDLDFVEGFYAFMREQNLEVFKGDSRFWELKKTPNI